MVRPAVCVIFCELLYLRAWSQLVHYWSASLRHATSTGPLFTPEEQRRIHEAEQIRSVLTLDTRELSNTIDIIIKSVSCKDYMYLDSMYARVSYRQAKARVTTLNNSKDFPQVSMHVVPFVVVFYLFNGRRWTFQRQTDCHTVNQDDVNGSSRIRICQDNKLQNINHRKYAALIKNYGFT